MNLSLLLAAIAIVESGNNDLAIGSKGERSRYQIRECVWRQHTRWPFFMARQRTASARIAWKHINWLISQGVPFHPYDLAIAWNRGLVGYKRWTKQYAPNRYAAKVLAEYKRLVAEQTMKGN